jgi:hypothetical protein
MNNPLLLLLVNCRTRIILKVNTPAPPTPLITLPVINTAKLLANAQINAPDAKKKAETKIISPGEKIMANRPTRGAIDAMVMR